MTSQSKIEGTLRFAYTLGLKDIQRLDIQHSVHCTLYTVQSTYWTFNIVDIQHWGHSTLLDIKHSVLSTLFDFQHFWTFIIGLYARQQKDNDIFKNITCLQYPRSSDGHIIKHHVIRGLPGQGLVQAVANQCSGQTLWGGQRMGGRGGHGHGGRGGRGGHAGHAGHGCQILPPHVPHSRLPCPSRGPYLRRKQSVIMCPYL